MGAITFSGLASGLDTASMVQQLVAAERSQTSLIAARQSALDTQKNIVGNLSSVLSALGTSVRALDLDTEIRPRAVSVTDTRIGVAVSSAAAPGAHDLRVKSLATTSVTQSKAFTSTGAGVLGDGGVDITVAGVTKSVAWTSADSLDAIASRINAADAGVNASVLQVDATNYRLVVTAKNSGTAAAPTFVDTGTAANHLDLAVPENSRIAAANAVVTINGIDVTRPTNVISDALAGMTFTLNSVHAATDANAQAAVTLDQKTLNERVKKVVDSFNAVNTALHVQLDYTGTAKGSNTLFGDSTLRQLQSSLGKLASDPYGASNLGALGISRDKTGAMTFDETKLAAAVAADPDALSKVFITAGFVTAVSTLTDQYTRATDGILATKTQGMTDRRKAMQTQIDRINTNADALEVRLQRQFSALEQAMTQLQSQSSYLVSMLR